MVINKTSKKRVSKKKTARKSTAGTRTSKKSVTRKGTRRSTKKTASKTLRATTAKTSSGQSLVADIEQVVSKSRAQLAKAHEKEVVLRRKAVEKVQKQLAKALERQQTLKDRKAAAIEKAAEKRTQAALNQVVRAREALRELNAKIKALREELKAAKVAHRLAGAARNKFVAMEKALEKFEREWAKKNPANKKVKRRARRRPVKAREKEEESAVTEISGNLPVPVQNDDKS